MSTIMVIYVKDSGKYITAFLEILGLEGFFPDPWAAKVHIFRFREAKDLVPALFDFEPNIIDVSKCV